MSEWVNIRRRNFCLSFFFVLVWLWTEKYVYWHIQKKIFTISRINTNDGKEIPYLLFMNYFLFINSQEIIYLINVRHQLIQLMITIYQQVMSMVEWNISIFIEIYLFLGFNRDHRIRSSLPFIVKPAVNTSKSNSLGRRFFLFFLFNENKNFFLLLGLCFLICANETKKVLLPANISCLDTLKALFVR